MFFNLISAISLVFAIQSSTFAASNSTELKLPPALLAQNDSAPATPESASPAKTTDITNMTLSDLLNIKVSVATGSKSKSQTTRETPGIISVISEDDIRKMGAKDLIDVLRYVPGFSPSLGTDTQGSVGMVFRGLRATEGRLLLQINGFNFTEFSFSNVPIGHRFPVDVIKKIEIIRGPGSAIYGGFAELAVVNVILKDAKDFDGAYASALYAQMAKDYGRKYVTLGIGEAEGRLESSTIGFLGNANLSDRDYVNPESGRSYKFSDETEYSSRFLMHTTNYSKWSLRAVYAEYKILNQDEWLDPVVDSYDGRWLNEGMGLSRDWNLLDEKLTLSFSVDFMRNKPWNTWEEWTRAVGYWINDQHDRLTTKISGLYRVSDNADVIVGVENMHNNTVLQANNGTFGNVDARLNYSTLALFAQGSLKVGAVNFTVGGRHERFSVNEDSAFVPRGAITWVHEDLHAKFLYSEAYRSPTGTQYFGQQTYELKPEKAQVMEIEGGMKVGERLFVTANVFNILMSDTIRYQYVSANNYYQNTPEIGTKGGELEVKMVDEWGNITGSVSHYIATKRGWAPQASSLDDKAFIGTPRNKLTLAGTYNWSKNLFISPSMSYQNKIYSLTNADSYATEKELDSEMIVNLNVLYTSAFNIQNLNLSLGVFNMFDEVYQYTYSDNDALVPQPNDLPGPSREFAVRASYSF